MEDPSLIFSVLNLVIIVLIILHIRKEAKLIEEPWKQMIIPVILFWWFVYPLWLFLWPGLHRPSRQGKDPETFLAHTWARRRLARKRERESDG